MHGAAIRGLEVSHLLTRIRPLLIRFGVISCHFFVWKKQVNKAYNSQRYALLAAGHTMGSQCVAPQAAARVWKVHFIAMLLRTVCVSASMRNWSARCRRSSSLRGRDRRYYIVTLRWDQPGGTRRIASGRAPAGWTHSLRLLSRARGAAAPPRVEAGGSQRRPTARAVRRRGASRAPQAVRDFTLEPAVIATMGDSMSALHAPRDTALDGWSNKRR